VLHDDLFTKGVTPKPARPSNIALKSVLGRGDVPGAFAAADVVIEGRYETAAVHQGYVEPHACVASFGADGQSTIWCSSQGQFLGAPKHKLPNSPLADRRVPPAEIGGGFGGKTTVYLEPVALALSKKCGRPVKMVMSREEVFHASGPTSGTVIDIKLAATKDG